MHTHLDSRSAWFVKRRKWALVKWARAVGGGVGVGGGGGGRAASVCAGAGGSREAVIRASINDMPH